MAKSAQIFQDAQDARQAFVNGSVYHDNDAKLKGYIRGLAGCPVPNEKVRHLAIVRCLAINHIQMERAIRGLNKRNNLLTFVVIALAITTILVNIFG